MKVTIIVSCAVCVYLVYCDVGMANYSLECPDISHWKIRADRVCNGNTDKYHCLYDPNEDKITEFCADPKDYTAGYMAVQRGNIDADICPGNRYMPFNFKSNMTKNCIFLKSKCNGEGQLVYHNWSLAEDVSCMCDFSNGYAFIQKPKNTCFCVPSKEDCSCYKKQCNINYILSPDYGCIISKLVKTQPSDSYNFQCHPCQDRTMPETSDRMISISPSLSDVSSSCIETVPCNISMLVAQFILIIMMVPIVLILCITLIFLIYGYWNEDDGNKQNDTSKDIRQTVKANEKNSTELPKTPVDTNLNEEFLNKEEKKKQDSSNDICLSVDSRGKNTTGITKQPVDNNLKVDDYFIINCEHYMILQFFDGVKLQKEFERKPRILDMCFVELHNDIHLVYIDADNKSIVVRGFAIDIEPREEKLSHEPNRLAKIDNNTVGVIYKKELHILIFNVCKMERMFTYSITKGGIVECDGGIQGILALSQTELILSDKIHLYRCKLDEHTEKAEVSDFAASFKDKFDTARRLTHVTVSRGGRQSVIFVADENDKKLTSIGQTENLIDDHTGQNRGLQNVRAIGATEQRVYAATSAGISVFRHDKGHFKQIDDADYRMLVEYEKHVEHTRGLCIHLYKDYIYIGLSCVIRHEDVVLVFKFQPNDTFK